MCVAKAGRGWFGPVVLGMRNDSDGPRVEMVPVRDRRRVVRVSILVLILAAPGCVGPRSLELTRLRYDQAVSETTEQQWLRNIVRLRYGDLPSFLDVSADHQPV